jgi:hypothetical protein
MKGFTRSLAIFVAIDRYATGIPDLKTPVSDAEAVAQVLRQAHGFETEIIGNEKATARRLRSYLARLSKRVSESDRVIFFFAGHGTASEGDEGPQGYLLPHDADPRSRRNHLAMKDLDEALAKLKCRHLLVILDCCFAGAYRWSSTRHLALAPDKIYDERFSWFVESPAWQAIASASHDQKAADVGLQLHLGTRDDGKPHSLFARALIDGLLGAADLAPKGGEGDGVITATELFLYIDERLRKTTRRNVRQTPLLWPLKKHVSGQYVFLVPGKELSLPAAPKLKFSDSPWRSLQPYDEGDADLFYGRSKVSEPLSAVIIRPVANQIRDRLVVVTGPSGVGKSSLVKAGVVPRLRNAGARVFVFRPTAGGLNPYTNLAAVLREADADAPTEEELRDRPESLADFLNRQAGSQTSVLVVDQAEELVRTGSGRPTDQSFVQLLASALGATDGRFRLVVTIPTEFEPRFVDGPFKSVWPGIRFTVPQMAQDDLRRVIEGPAAKKVLRFESAELVEKLVNEVVGMPGGLPLLSFALSQMYRSYIDRKGTDRTLGEHDYDALRGGVVGSLRVRANQLISEGDAAHRATARRVLERFVLLDGGRFIRRKVLRAEFDIEDQAEHIRTEQFLQSLIDERLLVTDSPDPPAEKASSASTAATLEFAHDALISSWDQLDAWVSEDTATTRELRRLTRDATDWSAERGKGGTGLWHGKDQIAVLRKLSKNPRVALSRIELTFANTSHRHFVRTKYLRSSVISILLFAGLIPIYAWYTYFRVATVYCADFVMRWERAECVSPIDDPDRSRRTITYRLTTKGQNPIELAKVDGRDRPTTRERSSLDTDGSWLDGVATVRYEAFDAVQRPTRTTYLNENGVVIKRVSYDFEADGSTAVAQINESLGVSFSQAAETSAISGANDDNDARARIAQHRLVFDASGFVLQRTFHSAGSLDPIRDSLGSYGQKYTRDVLGRAVTIANLTADGAELIDRKGVAKLAREFNDVSAVVSVKWLGPDGAPVPNRFGVSIASFEYDAGANLILTRYLNAQGQPVQRIDVGIASVIYRRDEAGNELERSFRDRLNRPTLDKELGYARSKLEYNVDGEVVLETYFDIGDKPTLRKDSGVGGMSYHYDQLGNRTEVNYLGTDGRLVIRSDYGFATKRNIFDANSRLIEESYYGLDGKATLDNVAGIAKAVWKHDGRGNEIHAAYYGLNGEPTLRKEEGIAAKDAKFDRQGNRTGETYFGVDNKPIIRKDRGYASYTSAYDERGNLIENTYLDADNKLTIDLLFGCASFRREYDDRGNKVSEAFFGTKREPILLKEFGYFRRTAKFDGRGNEVEERYLGVNEEPIVGTLEGAHGVIYKYDARGNKVDTQYIGTDSQPVISRFGYSREKNEFDDRGNETASYYFDAKDNPTLDKELAAFKVVASYDTRDNLIEAAYFDLNEMPTIRKDNGFAKIRVRYDKNGWLIEKAFFGIDGKPITDKEFGAARITYRPDERGNWFEERTFGPDGTPVLRRKDGIATIISEYDGFGRDIKESYFGVDGKPILDTIDEVSSVRSTYDDRGNQIGEASFGVDNKPILSDRGFAERKIDYDARGNKLQERFFGTDGKPILRSDLDVASWTSKYDSRGNKVEWSFFDELGNPKSDSTFGAAKIVYHYDSSSRQIGMDFFDERNNPVVSSYLGVASYRDVLDEFGRTIEETFFGADGKQALNHQSNVSKVLYTYDDKGNRISGSYFGLDGKLRIAKDKGYAKYAETYDSSNNLTDQFLFDANSTLSPDKFGVAHYAWTYDVFGNKLSELYFGPDKRPTLYQVSKVAAVSYVRDAHGQIVSESYTGIDGAPKPNNRGFARKTTAYDVRGQKIDERYFSAQGDPTNDTEHQAAHLRWSYDEFGREVSLEFFDAQGLPTLGSSYNAARVHFSYDRQGKQSVQALFDTNGNAIKSP